MPDSTDPHDLNRFVAAQRDAYAQALAELRSGRKRSHWMWYIFPQIAGLGVSAMSRRYAITDLAEAEADLRHPLLRPRLCECAEAVLAVEGRSAREILGFTGRQQAEVLRHALCPRLGTGLGLSSVTGEVLRWPAGSGDWASAGPGPGDASGG